MNIKDAPTNRQLPSLQALALFITVILAWGTTWPVTKLIVQVVPPIWTTALRCWIAFAALLVILPLTGNLIIPHRRDVPVVLSVAILHMVLFTTLVAAGLRFLPASKAIVIGYTTPLWVALAAPIFINEPLTRPRVVGVVIGLLGLGLILNPLSIDWGDRNAVLGCGMITLAALCWAASILYVRSHRWIATPLQLVIWQVLVAGLVLSVAALTIEGSLQVTWSSEIILLLIYGGLVGTALAYWAMSMVNKNLPALTTALGTTATPVVGIFSGALLLGEQIDVMLVGAAALIIGGIVISEGVRR
jgi:drug/metabolite transporter (DMT)-like permease